MIIKLLVLGLLGLLGLLLQLLPLLLLSCKIAKHAQRKLVSRIICYHSPNLSLHGKHSLVKRHNESTKYFHFEVPVSNSNTIET